MSDRLLPDWGWACILQARHADWAARRTTSFIVDEVAIEIDPGGAWRCAAEPSAETAELLDLFLPLVAQAGPWVIAQLGQSLDGRIATASGASHYINAIEARAHLHRLRALVDAVVVGVGTVNADDPQLTVRHVSGANPLRVVLDPKSRAATQARVFHEAAAPTLHLVSDSRPPLPDDSTPLAPGELRRCVLPCGAEGFEPAAVLRWLREAGYRRVLVEGGGVTVSRFLQAGVLDRLHVMVAPMLIGSGRPGLVLPPIDTLNEAIRPASRCFACGVDTLFDLDLRASDLRV
ncbi:RibD family protein [Thauera sp.]|jgi:riboflavin-specific deaminase-like protein|uniref:RibD family protein n=1 Tax=Thauera sp. TaxID=1905334 RepID=UPI002A359062|nr:dihydrofolate reductase family protein [Thauera sp.]MDX9886453.1 dihydrofolate reductase family protein [Thauera sp.]